jgi:hypothetical protein
MGETKRQHSDRNVQFNMIMDSLLSTLVYRVIDLHNRSLVTTPVAVIWGREDGNDLSVVLPLVSFHD